MDDTGFFAGAINPHFNLQKTEKQTVFPLNWAFFSSGSGYNKRKARKKGKFMPQQESFLATPKGNRLHIGIFGRRNAGKSSLLNALTRQNSAIVSPTAGTTTDPVEKPMELLPLGPVLFIDTAGIDDSGALGEQRIEKTRQVLDRTDIAILVVDCTKPDGWASWEESLLDEFAKRQTPTVVVFGKTDLAGVPQAAAEKLRQRNIPMVYAANPQPEAISGDGPIPLDFFHNTAQSTPVSQEQADKEAEKTKCRQNRTPAGTAELRDALMTLVPDDFLAPPPIVADLVPPGELAILVTPIDKEAPKGRLILPEVQTLRDLLDHGRLAMVVQTEQLAEAIRRGRPKLVVTDSQAFAEVSQIVPAEIPLTSFSILFARQKGDFSAMLDGAKKLLALNANAKILIAEACSHHPIAEDIGTEKIPRLLRKRLGETITIGHVQGHDFPANDSALAEWDLVIHCGGCVWNRREMLRRIGRCAEALVPVTNYGLAIAALNGILERAIEILNQA